MYIYIYICNIHAYYGCPLPPIPQRRCKTSDASRADDYNDSKVLFVYIYI